MCSTTHINVGHASCAYTPPPKLPRSTLAEMGPDTRFEAFLPDPKEEIANKDSVRVSPQAHGFCAANNWPWFGICFFTQQADHFSAALILPPSLPPFPSASCSAPARCYTTC